MLVNAPYFDPIGYMLKKIYEWIFGQHTTPIPNVKKIAVLGMQESGKTQFLMTLKNEEYSSYLQTAENEYDGFDVVLPSGKTIKIASGIDLGGSDHYISEYKRVSSGCDAVIFVFDAYKFKNNAEYRLKTRSRAQFFHDGLCIQDGNKVIMGSFADKFTTKDELVKAIDYVHEHLKDVYPNIKNSNFFIADMRDRELIMNCISKIFL